MRITLIVSVFLSLLMMEARAHEDGATPVKPKRLRSFDGAARAALAAGDSE
jgi:hypothetical protein